MAVKKQSTLENRKVQGRRMQAIHRQRIKTVSYEKQGQSQGLNKIRTIRAGKNVKKEVIRQQRVTDKRLLRVRIKS